MDARPEIDREKLKNMLLNSVLKLAGEGIVKWGKQLQSIDVADGVLTFKDGSRAGHFDLVVGADGA